MANITPYIRAQYPTIEGNDRVYFDNEFRKIQECIRSIIAALVGPRQDITIASGAVTLEASSSPIIFSSLDTEGAAASDDLDTVSGGKEGQLLIIKAANNARTVVCKDGTGNLNLAGDFSLDNVEDDIILYNKSGTVWRELSRSDNGA